MTSSTNDNTYNKKHGNLVKTIWAIDAALVMLVLFVAYMLFDRYMIAPKPEEPPMPRDLHFDDFVPLDVDGNIHLCEHFLSYDEIDTLLELVDDTGGWEASPTGGEHFKVPNSDGTWKKRIQSSSIIETIEQRIAKVTEIPIHPHEDMLHIAKITTHGTTPRFGHFPPFGLHHDTDTRPWRKRTLLVYLTTVPEGGRTIFPLSTPLKTYGILDVKMGKFRPDLAKQLNDEAQGWNRQVTFPLESEHPYLDLIESSCRGEIGVTVQPVAGTAIMFDHIVNDDSSHPNVNMWHAGCNVLGNDEKILLQKFKEKKIHRRKDPNVQRNSQRTKLFRYNSYYSSSTSRKISRGKRKGKGKGKGKGKRKRKEIEIEIKRESKKNHHHDQGVTFTMEDEL